MTHPIRIPLGTLPPIPNDLVHLNIRVVPRACLLAPGSRLFDLAGLQSTGVDLTISSIVAYGAMHFANAASGFIGLDEVRAMTLLAWTNLAAWSPRAVMLPSKTPRLVVSKLGNSRLQAFMSEILAVGVGLQIAKRFYSVPFRFWEASPGLSNFDYWTHAPAGQKIRLEVRGRFNGSNLAPAVLQVENKFSAIKDFNRAMGVIFCPHDSLTPRATDIWLVDPENPDTEPQFPTIKFRMLLRHYAAFFAFQGFGGYAKRMRGLSEAPEEEFQVYLRSGDRMLQGESEFQTHFKVGGALYKGTFFDGAWWPASLFPILEFKGRGGFFWGLHEEVIKAIGSGQLARVADMDAKDFTSAESPFVHVQLDDGSALAWAPSLKSLAEHE